MCTSFTAREGGLLVAMNFDNNGMPFSVQTKSPGRFVVLVDGGRGRYPSFGVNSEGTFINSLCVDSNGKGLYKRAGKRVTHTSRLTDEILSGRIPSAGIDQYLTDMEVVNVPDFSVHNMIVDAEGNVWVVEPGRGVLRSHVDETPYFVMSNFSLLDMAARGAPYGDGAGRYATVAAMLNGNPAPDVDAAFAMLQAAAQNDGEWVTDFSMVYAHRENAVYYCYQRDFDNIEKYTFAG